MCHGTDLRLKKSMTIGELKNMKIFDGKRRKCPPDSFTLGDRVTGKKLEDDVTLGSLAPYLQDGTVSSIDPHLFGARCLNFYSCSYYILQDSLQSHQKTFVNTEFPSKCYWLDVITQEIGQRKSQRKNNPMVFPRGTVLIF